MPRYNLNDKQRRAVSKIINKKPENIHYMVMPNEGFTEDVHPNKKIVSIENARLKEIGWITIAQAFKL